MFDVSVQWAAGGESCNPTMNRTGVMVNTILTVLEELDSYVFEKLDPPTNCLDSLYTRLFTPVSSSSSSNPQEIVERDSQVVLTLCEWATTDQRSGYHRGFVVSKLLERRQNEIAYLMGELEIGENDAETTDTAEEVAQQILSNGGPPLFQQQLFHYLDNDAPSVDKSQEFANLILLFHELIAQEVFSHNHYMCSLISRGDLNGPIVEAAKLQKEEEEDDDKNTSFDDKEVNDDLNNLLNQIKQGNQLDSSPFSPPKAPKTPSPLKDKESSSRSSPDVLHMILGVDLHKLSRHWQYTYHFPLSQEETSIHDNNQRHVMLYGVGKGKDEVSKYVRRLLKDVTKLFSKKFSIDITDGGRVKKHSKSEFIFEAVVQKFQALSYYDQHTITHICGQQAIDMLTSFASGSGSSSTCSSHLPVADYVSFLFDLAGMGCNVQELLDWCMTILKELPNIEARLIGCSSLTRTYTTTLALYCVGVLRKYHKVFILNVSDAVQAFDQLLKIAYKPKLPSLSSEDGRAVVDCNSAEWCILAYLHELSSSVNVLKSRDKAAELKKVFSVQVEPSISSCSPTDRRFGMDYIQTPKKKIDPLIIQLLTENSQNQYNLVFNVLIEVCECNDTDKLNDIAIMCCELTAQCPTLASEWLGALKALCQAEQFAAYHDLVTRVSLSDPAIYNRLGIFVSILTARHCFQLQAFGMTVAIPSVLKVIWGETEGEQVEKFEGARLSCHLLLKLFKTVESSSEPLFYTMGSPSPMPRPSIHASGIKHSCDRQLLSSAHRNIQVGAIVAVLKVVLYLGSPDDEEEEEQSATQSIEGRLESATLQEFARYTLQQLCSQEWVRERCLQSPDDLLKSGTLLDRMLSLKQAQKLLRLMCVPPYFQMKNSSEHNNCSQRELISKMLGAIDEWNLRVFAVELKLMHHQPLSSNWLDDASKAIVDAFQLVPEETTTGKTSTAADTKKRKYPAVWILPYLVKNLSFLQNHVLKVSCDYLERSNWSRGNTTSSSSVKSARQSSQQLAALEAANTPASTRFATGHQPFLQLVLTCLKELDSDNKSKQERGEEHKENLLQCLHTQLSMFMCFNKDEKLYNYEDPTARKAMQDALQLRFSLVGGMFDTICRSTASVTDWSTLLVQLIVRGVVGLTNNSDLFTSVLDMLAILIHSALINDRESSSSSGGGSGQVNQGNDDGRKNHAYHALVKKLKKEIGDRNNVSIKYLRQLLPLQKVMKEIIVTEPFGTVNDGKGNKTREFVYSDKKTGLQMSEKQKVSPWDLLEGFKSPAPLAWSWFGSVRHDKKPLRMEESFAELKYVNTSTLEKNRQYFVENPPLPQEDLEQTQVSKEVRPEEEHKNQILQSTMQVPSPMMNRTGAHPVRPQQANMAMPMQQAPFNNRMQMQQPQPQQQQQQRMMGGGPDQMFPNQMPMHWSNRPEMGPNFNPMGPNTGAPMQTSGGMFPQGNNHPPPPHYNAAIAQQQQQQQQQQMMNPSMQQSNNMGGNNGQRFGGFSGNQTSSKQALQNMLRARHPSPGFSNNQAYNRFPPNRMPQQQMFNNGMGPQGNTNMRMAGGQFQGMTANQQQFGGPNFQGQQGMNNYMMQPRGSQPGYNMGGGRQAGGGMMGQNQGGFMGGPRMMAGGNQSGFMQQQQQQQAGMTGNMGPQANYRMNHGNNKQQSNLNLMRMQNPQLLAQLQRGPANAPQNNQQGNQMNSYQQNRF